MNLSKLLVCGLVVLLPGCSRQVEAPAVAVESGVKAPVALTRAPALSAAPAATAPIPTARPAASAANPNTARPTTFAASPSAVRQATDAGASKGAVGEAVRPHTGLAAASDAKNNPAGMARGVGEKSVSAHATTRPATAVNTQAAGRSVVSDTKAVSASTSAPVLDLPLAVVASQNTQMFQPSQAEALVRMGVDFLNATAEPAPTTAGTATQPFSSEVLWIDAQRQSDERFRTLFGDAAFNAMQIKRAQDAYAQTLAAQPAATTNR
jgi:hypothetical protein